MLYIELVWNVEHELWYGNQEMLSLHRSKELTADNEDGTSVATSAGHNGASDIIAAC